MNILATPGVNILERDVKRPTFSATLDTEAGKGGQVEIVIGSDSYTVMIDPADGSWSFTWPEDLDDGTYSLSIRVTDKAGNDGHPKLYNLVISTTPPEPPTLFTLDDDQGDKTGFFKSGETTDDLRPTLTGLAKPGSIVVLMRDGEEIGSAVADAVTGLWSLEPNQDLADGENNLTLVTRDIFAKKDRESEESEPFTIVVGADIITPAPGPGIVFIDGAEDNVGTNTGPLTSGALTDDTRPELHGTAPANSTLRMQYRSEKGDWIEVGNVPVNADGSWSWAPVNALPDGSWEFRVRGEAGWTDEFALEINGQAQTSVIISYASDNKGPYTGELANGAITDDDTPSLHGRAEANSIVYIHGTYNGSDTWNPMGSVIAGPDGNWSLTTMPLPLGNWRFQAGANAAADPQADTFLIDLITPGSRAPVILGAWDDVGNITGPIENGTNTNDTYPELRGTAEANSVVMIEYGKAGEPYSTGYSVTANASGEWSFTPPQPLELGGWVFRTKTANGTSYSNSWGFTVTEGEVNTFVHDFEDQTVSTISSGWKYGQITLSAIGSGTSFGISDLTSRNIGVGKVLKLVSLSTSTTTELARARLDFDEKVNFVQLDAIEWESTSAYVTYHNSAGVEIGRRYATDVKATAREELSFYTAENDIAYIQFYLSARVNLTHFFIDNIIIKQNYTPPVQPNAEEPSLYDVNGAELELINGGNDVDTLVMSGQQQTLVMSEVTEQFSSVEVVDITGSGDNRLALNIGDVLDHGGRDLFVDDGKLQFMVQGDEGDTVQLDDLLPDGTDTGDWIAQNGTVTVAGVEYQVFSHSGEEVEVLIQQGIKTELI
ncbi:hypothetical protein J8I88_02275 [Duffyella gerundensis]|uniref:Ig-like domain-containing protein n=1 Tax=Duffyella gerundensis TaxID=1619313 RepID=UPI001AE0F172|nr:Ig-like domain-containing protein [Duffyella gerundensis]QTO54729.1 hypothetical protein J8I88_02275 [Duffyella gerundensis]